MKIPSMDCDYLYSKDILLKDDHSFSLKEHLQPGTKSNKR